MPKPSPQYRTDHLACPLNAGKLGQVRELVVRMRKVAGLEATWQWQQFYQSHWQSFESMATKGWSRPWVQEGRLNTTFSQLIMSQVAGSLKGYFGNVQNSYTRLVSGSTLPANIRHQLHFINRKHAWFWKCDVKVRQAVESNTKASTSKVSSGKNSTGQADIIVSEEVRALARTLIRKAMSLHRKPHFKRFQPQFDQRTVFLQKAHTATSNHLWLMLSGLHGGSKLALPVIPNEYFLERQEQASFYTSLANAGLEGDQVFNNLLVEVSRAKEGFTGNMEEQTKKSSRKQNQAPIERNPHPTSFAIAKSIRLILANDQQSVSVAVATDMTPVFSQSIARYQPRMETLALDLGMATLLGSDQGHLLGQNWLKQLERYDHVLQGIARHRQSLGLKTASPRYRQWMTRLRGFLKTEINRIFNRLVEIKAPSHLIMETPGFYRNPKLSRRLNRLMSNFGARLVTDKLKELEVQFGITTEFVNPAYSSQTCSGCGYVDARNRQSQSWFFCKFCNKTLHADVNAPRNLLARRSCTPAQSTGKRFEFKPHKKQILVETMRRFNQRYTRPRGGPADPRYSNPYFKDWNTQVRSSEAAMLPSSCCVLV